MVFLEVARARSKNESALRDKCTKFCRVRTVIWVWVSSLNFAARGRGRSSIVFESGSWGDGRSS